MYGDAAAAADTTLTTHCSFVLAATYLLVNAGIADMISRQPAPHTYVHELARNHCCTAFSPYQVHCSVSCTGVWVSLYSSLDQWIASQSKPGQAFSVHTSLHTLTLTPHSRHTRFKATQPSYIPAAAGSKQSHLRYHHLQPPLLTLPHCSSTRLTRRPQHLAVYRTTATSSTHPAPTRFTLESSSSVTHLRLTCTFTLKSIRSPFFQLSHLLPLTTTLNPVAPTAPHLLHPPASRLSLPCPSSPLLSFRYD